MEKLTPLFELTNGIFTPTEDDGTWNSRGAEWFNLRTAFKAQAFQYKTTALTRWIGQAARVARLARRWERAKNYGYSIVGCGHSNGVLTSVEAAKQFSGYIPSMHLFEGAMTGDCEKSGVNALLRENKVGRITFYCSKGDLILKYVAPLSRWMTLGIGGYGSVGYTGPFNIDPEFEKSRRIRVVWRNSFGHGDWFSGDQFEATMKAILQDWDLKAELLPLS